MLGLLLVSRIRPVLPSGNFSLPTRLIWQTEVAAEKGGSKRLTASTTFSGQIASTQVTFVVVPTPSEESGAFSTKLVEKAMKSIGEELKRKKELLDNLRSLSKEDDLTLVYSAKDELHNQAVVIKNVLEGK